MSELRPYQIEMIDAARREIKSGIRSIILCAPTGSGKTLLTAHMLRSAAQRGMYSWFIVHRRELLHQSEIAFLNEGIDHGIIASDRHGTLDETIQIASVQTLARRRHLLKDPRFIIWDECHHIAASSWAKIFSAYPKAIHIGLTATPIRLDGAGLYKYFSKIIEGPSTSDLIKSKYLSPYRLFAPGGISTDGIHTRMGDYVQEELIIAADRPSITGCAIAEYRKNAFGKRALVFCVSIQHSKNVAAQFRAAGIMAEHVDGETDNHQRDRIIKSFESGGTRILCSVNLFSEGLNIESVEAAILLRPTQSLGLYLQQIGRTLRIYPGKEASIILDHSGNCQRHGMPCERREWTLNGQMRRSKQIGVEPSVTVCPQCFGAMFHGTITCKYCGYFFEKKPRQIKELDGNLVEINNIFTRRTKRKEVGRARSLVELQAIGRERGYKPGWAWAIYNSRQKKAG